MSTTTPTHPQILSKDYLLSFDPQLQAVASATAQWAAESTPDVVAKGIESLKANGHNVIVVDTRADALAILVDSIPAGSSVNTPGSTTLEEIGFADALSTNAKGWRNVKAEIAAETDQAKAQELRRTVGLTVDYHVSSVNAIDASTGRLHIADAGGNRVAPLILGPKNVIIVTSTNKFVADAETARRRVREHVHPLVSAAVRIRYGHYGFTGTTCTNYAEIDRTIMGNGRTIIVINETLGF